MIGQLKVMCDVQNNAPFGAGSRTQVLQQRKGACEIEAEQTAQQRVDGLGIR